MRQLAVIFAFLFAVAAFGEANDDLARNWERYMELFRSPREIFFEVKRPAEDAALSGAAQALRSHPEVEDTFAISACGSDPSMVYLLLNSPPAEFGAFLEKLRPHLVRQAFRNFAAYRKTHPRGPEPACVEEPLGLLHFISIPGDVPIFKQPIPAGVYVRLREGLRPEIYRNRGVRLESDLRRFFADAGFRDAEIVRRQDLPPAEPRAGDLGVALWLAASTIGAACFALCHRRLAPYLGLLAMMLVVFLMLIKLSQWLPGFIDPRLLPAALAGVLFWGAWAAGAPQKAVELLEGKLRRRILFLLAAGLTALAFSPAVARGALRESGLFLALLPAGIVGLLVLLAWGWPGEQKQLGVSPAIQALDRIFWARKNALMVFCMAGLCLFLGWRTWRERPEAFGNLAPLLGQFMPGPSYGVPQREQARGPWALSPDHALADRTLCVVFEGNDWGEILFQLGAQKFAAAAAKQEKLVSRYWTPAVWVPRAAWQKSNATDFLKKRNVVVLEKIARQEGLDPEDFRQTIAFLNKVGEAAVPLASGERDEWNPALERNAFGLRMRQWVRVEPDGTHVAASYLWPAAGLPQTTLMPWIDQAVRSFGVEPEWVAPSLLERRALNQSAREMLVVALMVLVLLWLGGRAVRIRAAAAATATFLFLASWLLTLIGFGGQPSVGQLWVWTSVLTWHSILLLAWHGRESGVASPLAATLVTACTWAAALLIWPQIGPTGEAARALATGILWSIAWTVLLAAAPEDKALLPAGDGRL